jgi:hypothetical protein
MIEDSFDARTLAYMNVALDRVCEHTSLGEQHGSRARRARHYPLRKKRQDLARSFHRGWGTRFGTYPGDPKNPRECKAHLAESDFLRSGRALFPFRLEPVSGEA